MNLTEHFTVAEFTASDTAARHNIDNDLPATLLAAARTTCEMLERIRTVLTSQAGHDVPIDITSGYRCQALNAAIGSSVASDHIWAMAADFRAPAYGKPYDVAKALAPLVSELGIGQLILEYESWVHVSTRMPDKRVNRIITINRAGTHVGIQEAA